MYEDLERDVGRRRDPTNLLECQFPRQDHLREAQRLQLADLLGCPVVHLCRGMEGNRGQVHAEDAHVLYDEGIDPGPVKGMDHSLGVGQLIVHQDGVKRHVDPDAIGMGVVAQALDIFQAVTRRRTGAKTGCANVNGVGAVVDGLQAACQVASGRQKLDGSAVVAHFSSPRCCISLISKGVS